MKAKVILECYCGSDSAPGVCPGCLNCEYGNCEEKFENQIHILTVGFSSIDTKE